jgi:hypothetical protein
VKELNYHDNEDGVHLILALLDFDLEEDKVYDSLLYP